MPTVTVDYFGFSGTGRTVKDAKLDAGRKIEKLSRELKSPRLIHWRGHAAVVFRDSFGWNYGFLKHPDTDFYEHIGGSCGHDDERAAIDACKRHIADIGWFCTVEDLDSYPDFLTEPRDRAEIRQRRTWCLKMNHLTAQGIQDQTARLIVGRMETCPEGITEWKEPPPCTTA